MYLDYTPKDVKRFWSYVDKSSGEDACWLWTAYRVRGYGRVYWGRKKEISHRVSYLLEHGSFPIQLEVLHTCDTPACCNPRHLFLGTQKDNMYDMIRKGRDKNKFNLSVNIGNPKLTREQVVEIRRLFDTHEITRSAVAKQFGITKSMVYFIGKRIRWSHIPELQP